MDDDFDETSDAQLVTCVARFDEAALAELYRRHGGAVFGLARRVTGSVAEAEDVTQEVFLRLWNRPEAYDSDRGALRSFLLTQSHARAVDVVRSRAARSRRELREAGRTPRAGYDVAREACDARDELRVTGLIEVVVHTPLLRRGRAGGCRFLERIDAPARRDRRDFVIRIGVGTEDSPNPLEENDHDR